MAGMVPSRPSGSQVLAKRQRWFSPKMARSKVGAQVLAGAEVEAGQAHEGPVEEQQRHHHQGLGDASGSGCGG